MHYLHPRSRTTGTLFTGTLAISFLVVALPHLLPCPVDRRQFADTIEMPDGTIKRRRKRKPETTEEDDVNKEVIAQVMDDSRPNRECPVPKPGGLVGQMMGFENKNREAPAEVVVQTLKGKKAREGSADGGEVP